MLVEFVGAGARDASSIASNPSRLFNLWGEKIEAGGRAKRLLRSALGMQSYSSADAVFAGDMFDLDGTLYAIVGGGLYNVTTGALLGAVTFGDSSLSRNYDKLTIASGGNYYVWDGTLAQPATGPFTSIGSVDFLAGRTIYTEKDGNKIGWTGIGLTDLTGGSPDAALNVASAESRSDNIIRGIVVGGSYYVLGERSTEVWAATGNGGADAFALLPGMAQDIGLKAFGLVTRIGGALFLVGDDDIVYIASGTTFQPVSIAPVATAIKEGQPKTCIYWEDRGQKFAAITFADRPAWVYTFTTGEWWERGEGVDYRAWRARSSVKFGNDWIVGADDGGFYKLTGLQDDGAVLLREATSLPVYNDGQFFTVAEFEAFASQGYVDASLMLEVAKDGRFGLSKSVTLSSVGNMSGRALFRALGRGREFVFRLGVTDPVAIDLWSAARVRVA